MNWIFIGTYIALFFVPLALLVFILIDLEKMWNETFGRNGKAKFKRLKRHK